jgi:hypothetical protein
LALFFFIFPLDAFCCRRKATDPFLLRSRWWLIRWNLWQVMLRAGLRYPNVFSFSFFESLSFFALQEEF